MVMTLPQVLQATAWYLQQLPRTHSILTLTPQLQTVQRRPRPRDWNLTEDNSPFFAAVTPEEYWSGTIPTLTGSVESMTGEPQHFNKLMMPQPRQYLWMHQDQ